MTVLQIPRCYYRIHKPSLKCRDHQEGLQGKFVSDSSAIIVTLASASGWQIKVTLRSLRKDKKGHSKAFVRSLISMMAAIVIHIRKPVPSSSYTTYPLRHKREVCGGLFTRERWAGVFQLRLKSLWFDGYTISLHTCAGPRIYLVWLGSTRPWVKMNQWVVEYSADVFLERIIFERPSAHVRVHNKLILKHRRDPCQARSKRDPL